MTIVRPRLVAAVAAVAALVWSCRQPETAGTTSSEPRQAAAAAPTQPPPESTQPLELISMTPTSTGAGQGFRVQPDGTSALGLRATGYTKGTRVYFGETPLVTFAGTAFVSANVPASLLAKAGTYPVSLREGSRRSNELSFVVK